MKQQGYTKGPWRFELSSAAGNDCYYEITGGRGYYDESTNEGFLLTGFIKLDDAALLAAAPDLLEALQELTDLMQGVIDGSYTPDSFTLQPAQNAIAKALGNDVD